MSPRRTQAGPALRESAYWELLPLLRKLDACLLAALELLPAESGEASVLRTLQPTRQELIAQMQQAAGLPRFAQKKAPSLVGKPAGSWAQLQTAYALDGFELDLLLLALAPELDVRYQRIYGALQDDPAQNHASVDLALNLLCATPHERLRRPRQLATDAPLFRHRLLQWPTERGSTEPLLQRGLRVAPDLVELLLNDGPPDATALALRQRDAAEMASLTRRLVVLQDWDDLVLPPDAMAQLRELCGQVQFRHEVLGNWGMGSKQALGRGVAALFSGPSGTGKTMAAGVVSRQLGRDLFRVDLSQVVSKYIGETEKNLSRIFDCAASINAVLFFDEADAMFGKRSEVKDAHDRHANVEVAYLLQKMEEYEGLAVLATNLRRNLDTAFLRRLHVVIDFPFPDEAQRLNIWQRMFPSSAPLAPDVDFAALARELRLSGGHLRNVALAAASLAASEAKSIHQSHLALAAKREYEKLGHSWTGLAAG